MVTPTFADYVELLCTLFERFAQFIAELVASFSWVSTPRSFSMGKVKNGRRLWCRQKNVWYARTAKTTKCASSLPFCACGPEEYWPHRYAFSPHISRG